MYQFAIDRGGTFTDVYARLPNGEEKVIKLLSVNPQYPDAPREAIRRVLGSPVGKPIDHSKIESIRMGTTVATNALLERKGTKTALLITKGFKDLLEIGQQDRPDIFDLKVERSSNLYSEVVEIDERVIPYIDNCQLDKSEMEMKTGETGEIFVVKQRINATVVEQQLRNLKESGIQSIAIVLVHSYAFPDHELILEKAAQKVGFVDISTSHRVMPMIKTVPRGTTTVVDAYLTPSIKLYVSNFLSDFSDQDELVKKLLFMRSDGGLTPVESFFGSRAVLSGPAGGVIGYAKGTFDRLVEKKPCIGFDMGGTSTDVSRWDGAPDLVFESKAANVMLQVPQLDIRTVAAGGGSILSFRGGIMAVGPESASAYPGPACYGHGGPATVTDANLILGRIIPELFPKIFGPTEDMPLNVKASHQKMQTLTDEINELEASIGRRIKTVEEIAEGFIKVANQAMCRPIRNLTEARGFDCRTHVLSVFGGAGGQHACSIASALNISMVSLHKHAGILSAFGISAASLVTEHQYPVGSVEIKAGIKHLNFDELERSCRNDLNKYDHKDIALERFLNLRYDGTDFPLMIPESEVAKFGNSKNPSAWENCFVTRYKKEFGFQLSNRDILVDDIRVRGEAGGSEAKEQDVDNSSRTNEMLMTSKVMFNGDWHHCAVYNLSNLKSKFSTEGPCVVICGTSTTIVEPGWELTIDKKGDIYLNQKLSEDNVMIDLQSVDPVTLSIFGHRFMSIAEQMGRVLQRTSISTNIKERLDFSCALFGPDGGLVSNAPHIPVHLGAMQQAVQFQLMQNIKINKGDVILSNHPVAGGSHLPDLTIITPVFDDSGEKIIFFLANRGHHADIGGATPGSMPPMSTHINEEGAQFISFKIVEENKFMEKELAAKLNEPSQYEGCSGSRNIEDNFADLKAQIAANQRGIYLVSELISEYSLPAVTRYMKWIQEAAETSVRNLLKKTCAELGDYLEATDSMDDGSDINLKITINPTTGDSIFDFTDSSPEVHGNLNAPTAVTYSAVIYCLRCLIGFDVPLNQGCLTPITIKLREGSILSPSNDAAVVGGNVLTSQRVVDVVLKCFDLVAASQGCMNNFCFGDGTIGYYETICGGSGAGNGWNGTSGIHTHMTNTRITDVEILEKRYPVILDQFTFRPNSGGLGKFRGGDGVIRQFTFRRRLDVSLLTERRVNVPYGLRTGKCGKKGKNILIRENGRLIGLPPKCALSVLPNQRIRLETPGGGGFG